MSIKRKLNYALTCLFWILATTTMHIVAQTSAPELHSPKTIGASQINALLQADTESDELVYPEQVSSTFNSLFVGDPFTGGTQIAVDRAGGYHIAYRDMVGNYPFDTVYYGYCAANCANSNNWGTVDVYADDTPLSKPINVRLELDPSDHPRLAWIQDHPLNEVFVVYVECDTDCLNNDNWAGTYVVGDGGGSAFHHNTVSSRWFTLDNQGHPRFMYHYDIPATGYDLRYSFCDGNCVSDANWYDLTIATATDGDPAYALDFTSSNYPRVAVASNGGLYYLSCDAPCTLAANWQITYVDEQLDESIQLTLDAQDRPRIARFFNSDVVKYDWCDSGCQDSNNWNQRALSAFPPYSGIGIDLLFDSQNRPHIGFVGNRDVFETEAGYVHCLNDCDTPDTSVWAYDAVEREVQLPEIPLVNSCDVQTWDLDGPASIALDKDDQIVLGYVTANYQFDTSDPTWNCVYQLNMQGPECTGPIYNPLCFLPVASQYPRVSILLENIFLPMIRK